MLYVYPIDRTGCGYYRVIWPAQAMDPDGTKIKVIEPGGSGGVSARTVQGQVVGLDGVPSDCDAVLLQRPTYIPLVACIPYYQKLGIKVIIEVDDDLTLLSPRHPTWQLFRELHDHDARAIRHACSMADVVIASTPMLAERMAPGRAVLLRNCLPRHLYGTDLQGPTHEHVGWPGAIGTHPDDLLTVGNALARLGQPVRIIGPENPRGKAVLGVEPEFTGPIPFDDWIPAVSTLHTAVSPLENTAFNRAKSWLKPLELSVAQVPFVCSPTPEYLNLGAGLTAIKPREWLRQLSRLMKEPGLREHEIGRNREIAGKWVLEDHIDEWSTAWGI